MILSFWATPYPSHIKRLFPVLGGSEMGLNAANIKTEHFRIGRVWSKFCDC